jgi:hypothetical protein
MDLQVKFYTAFWLCCLLYGSAAAQADPGATDPSGIDRKLVVDRHRIVANSTNPRSPAQVGNGEFAFGADITGLQTFIPFNTMAQWSWHSFPPPQGLSAGDFKATQVSVQGRDIPYWLPNSAQPELTAWLAGNPQRFNLGRIGLLLLKSDGTVAGEADLTDTRQEVDLWTGVIISRFNLEGHPVTVKTACHPRFDALGVSVYSELLRHDRIRVVVDFPYADTRPFAQYVGDYSHHPAHQSSVVPLSNSSVLIARSMNDAAYWTHLQWSTPARFEQGDTIASPHRFHLAPTAGDELAFTCHFARKPDRLPALNAGDVFSESAAGWRDFWESGAALDLSGSTDPRWRELERRVVLSQYLTKINTSGSWPPQEAGLVNNGWYGRYHFEMLWWHGVHFALWNRWPLVDRCLQVFRNFLPTSMNRAAEQGYAGARWPKCTANLDRDWPHIIHAFLIWQQPHPIYFAELDYRLHPGAATLEKWGEIVLQTANFMAGYAHYESEKDRYALGPPLYVVSENTDPYTTYNPAFELGYWRYGLRTAQVWRERLGLGRDAHWDDVLNKLASTPQEGNVYVIHEGIESMWTRYAFEHPALIGTRGMLPGDGTDAETSRRTLARVMDTWNFNHTWGWDFPMLAMTAARAGFPELAVDLLLHPAPGFQFDEHGLATGGPFPYFPSNGALLTAVAMMAAGWDGSIGEAPGFPKNGLWRVLHEGLNKMP